jgi:hypothetical protein
MTLIRGNSSPAMPSPNNHIWLTSKIAVDFYVCFAPWFPKELKGSLEHDRYTPHLPRDFTSSTGLNRSELWGSTNRAEYELLGSGIL